MRETMEKNIETEIATNGKPEVRYRGVKTMPLIIGNETFEKLGTIGASHNLLVYLTTVFNMKRITATTLVNIFTGTTNFATLPGAFLCDTYFGRYKTLAFASVSSVLGMLVLTLTAAIPNLHPKKCDTPGTNGSTCSGATPWQLAFLLGGLGFLVVGAAGIRPCNLAFGADQFDPKTESGKRGINSFFNWYYFTFTFAMMTSLTVIVYVQSDVSWSWGLGIPAFLMLLSCVFFFAGTRLYVKVPAEGSPLATVARVVVAAIEKRRLSAPEQPTVSLFNHIPAASINSKLAYTDQFRFLDKAAIMGPKDRLNLDGSAGDPWRLCSVQQVEEVKCIMRVIPIWSTAIIYCVATTQQSTYVVFQALQSNRRLGNTKFSVPAASFSVFSMLGLALWIPIYDRVLVPLLRRITGRESGITVLQRMGFGMVVAILTMILSGFVEAKRRDAALRIPAGGPVSPVSGFWLVPQLTLIGISEAFTVIGHVEFYYKQFPENMRSVGGSFLFVGMGLSNYLSGFLVSIVHGATDWLAQDLNRARLDRFYYLVAAMGVANFGYFLVFARWFKYKKTSGEESEVDMKEIKPEKDFV